MIAFQKEMSMSRVAKFLMLLIPLVFVLACNFVTQPIRDVQNLAGTAESLASAMPIETLQAIPSILPMETLEALPSALPAETLEAIPSAIAEFGNYFEPQGTPVSEWQGIPIMPQAVTGQEFNDSTYSFKVDVTPKEVQEYYTGELTSLGWSQTFDMPGSGNGAIMVLSKDSHLLTITIATINGETVVMLTLA
jgi:hypothetical protein